MNAREKEELRKLSLEELLKKFSFEDLEKKLTLRELLDKFPDVDDDPGGDRGVLLSDEIEQYARNFHLIVPFDYDKLRPASYTLNVGDEYSLGGIKETLDTPDKKIKIPPFQVAIIQTKEIINLPRFLIGRWNIRVTNAYDGLVWAGGPQVDPGWVGHLVCPIYNLSGEEVVLEKGDPFATIDFIRTTPFDKKGNMVIFPREHRYKDFDDYKKFKSALFTEVKGKIKVVEKKIKVVEEKIKDFGSRLDTSVGINLAVFAIIVTVLAIFVSSNQGVQQTQPWWFFLCITFSLIALFISIFVYSAMHKNLIETAKNWFIESARREKIYIVIILMLMLIIILTNFGKIAQWLK